jgi:4-amino-4-deoxychorismate lyase
MLIDGVPSDQLPATDRGLAYGDGLFETIRIHRGNLLFLEQHLQRLVLGCTRLGIPVDQKRWRDWLDKALVEAGPTGILKLIVTRGSGGRGYKPSDTAQPRCIISTHPLPAQHPDPRYGIRAFVCEQRLADQPVLAGIKHLNRLEQVLASREFPDSSWHEGLMRDYAGNIIEGTRSNLFIAIQGKLYTPELSRCGIAGILRGQLIEVFGDRLQVADLPASCLDDADEIFVCNSVLGIWPLVELRYAGLARELQVGNFAHEALRWFDGVLA